MCEIEERALISRLIAENLPIWNYEANRANSWTRDLTEEAHSAPVTETSAQDASLLEDEPGVMTPAEAFFATLSANEDAQTLCGRIEAMLVDDPEVDVYYTLTGGGDLRVGCTLRGRRKTVVANASWQPTTSRFVMSQYLPAAEVARLEVEAEDLTDRDYVPRNVRSKAFFPIPKSGQAMIDAVLRSIEHFKRDHA